MNEKFWNALVKNIILFCQKWLRQIQMLVVTQGSKIVHIVLETSIKVTVQRSTERFLSESLCLAFVLLRHSDSRTRDRYETGTVRDFVVTWCSIVKKE
jgi:hypothetical protein